MQHTDELKASSYATGHTPRMSYAQYVAHVNSRSAFLEDLSTSHDQRHSVVKRKLSKSAQKLLKVAKALPTTACLHELVTRERTPLLIADVLFGVKRTRFGWSLLTIAGKERQLNADITTCSCEDNRFRHRVCKHMEALRALAT